MMYVERWLFDLTEERKVPVNALDNVTTFKNKDSLKYPWTTVFLRGKFVNRLYEVPFYNGISIDEFEHSISSDILSKVKIRSMENTVKCNELKCINGKVYFKKDDEYYD